MIDKKNLKVGKTYEMTVKAKEGYYLEKIEINDKTYTLNNQETSYSVSFVAEEKNTVKIDAISTGIEDITVEKPSITAQEGRISIDTKGNAIKELQIYTSSGQLVYQKSEVQGTEEVALHSGIYITRYSLSNGKTEAVKIIVR